MSVCVCVRVDFMAADLQADGQVDSGAECGADCTWRKAQVFEQLGEGLCECQPRPFLRHHDTAPHA